MVNARHKEVLKASTSKGVESPTSDADRDNSCNESSSSSEALNFRGFTDEETKVLSSMISRQVGKVIKNVMPYYISQTTDNLKEVIQKELEEFKKEGIMKYFRNEMATYCDFTACDMPKFDGTLDPIANGLLSRARVREADLLRKKNKEEKETKRKLEFGDQDTKKPKHDHGRRGYYKFGALNYISKDYKKLMIFCYNFNQLGHKSNECPNPKAIEAKPMKSIKEEKVEKLVCMVMAAEEGKLVHDVVTGAILVNSIPARVLYDSGASISFVSHEFSKNLSTPPNKLPFPLKVEIADSKVVVVSNVYREVEIEIDDSIFRIDLIPIMLGVFDI
ncbi:putative reverse transcriptase domain-containing protein, partial [Tanacetum coccineum]